MSLVAVLRRFTIRTRMIGATGVVLVLMVVVGGIGMLGLQRSNHVVDRFIESIHRDTVLLSTLRADFGEVRRHEKDMMLYVGNQDKVAEHKAKWSQAVQTARGRADTLAGGRSDEGTQIARGVVERLGEYQAKAKPVWEQIESGALSTPADANAAFATSKQAAHGIETDFAALDDHLKKESAAEEVSRRTIQSQSEALFAVTLVVAAIVIVPAALANMASMCRPIDAARAHARRIADGDLTAEIADDGADEYARMFADLNAMQQSLRRLVGDLRSASENIGMASSEIATGNTDLSHRTEQTASNLQQAAGSLQQITGSVRQTAESASQANQLAASASVVAVRGGDAVAQVVATMGEIEASSRKIADIIGTIDGIAFQTNILALNAAVEAARAGEQGRGFAVVAGEVRTLAQRSAEAAREIKSLIGASVERVETGTRLVRDAGSTMNEIVDSVRRVTDVIGEITASASEQSAAIGKVNGAVTELDRMTQQNAALVEQSAAAAESLKDQAKRLLGVVDAFRAGPSPALVQPGTQSGEPAAAKPLPKPTPALVASTSVAPALAASPKAPPPAVVAPAAPRSPSEPAAQAQQVIARARAGTTSPGHGDDAGSDWESF